MCCFQVNDKVGIEFNLDNNSALMDILRRGNPRSLYGDNAISNVVGIDDCRDEESPEVHISYEVYLPGCHPIQYNTTVELGKEDAITGTNQD